MFRHEAFGDHELYCAKRWVKVTAEGLTGVFYSFDDDVEVVEQPTESREPGEDIELPTNLRGVQGDVAAYRALGLGVDDDNETAPENVPDNIPDPNAIPEDGDYATFGNFHGIDHCKLLDIPDMNPRVDGFQ